MDGSTTVIVRIGGILDISKEVLSMWGIMAFVLIVAFICTRRLREKPGFFQNLIEIGLEKLDGLFSDILGSEASRYYSYLASLFVFIIFSNYAGLLPGAGEWYSVPTSKLSVTAALALTTFIMTFFVGFRRHGLKYLKHYIKPFFIMLPFVIIDEIVRPMSLALRRYGNIFGEETVMDQLYELLPIGAPIIMMALSLLFCAIQAVVFLMLTCVYFSEASEELS